MFVVTSNFLKSLLCIHSSLVHLFFLAERENIILFSSCWSCVCVYTYIYIVLKKHQLSQTLFSLCSGSGRREWVCAGHCPARWPEDHQYVRWDCHRASAATAGGWPVRWLVEDKVRGNHLIHRHFSSVAEKLVWFRLYVAPQGNAETFWKAKASVSLCSLICIWCFIALSLQSPASRGSGSLVPAKHSY